MHDFKMSSKVENECIFGNRVSAYSLAPGTGLMIVLFPHCNERSPLLLPKVRYIGIDLLR